MRWMLGTPVELAAGLLLLLTALALLGYVRRRRRVARAIGDPQLVHRLLGVELAAVPWRRLLLVGLAGTAIAAALLDPRHTSPPRGGAPVVFVLDASGSMLADDVLPARLELQRELARSLAASLPGTPIGVVAFAGRAYALTPPTTDAASVGMYLATLDPTIVTHDGSAFGAAIRQGLGLIGAAVAGRGGGSLVLFGDGDETEDEIAVRAAADLARRAGVPVHTVGIGTPAGAPVPRLDLSTGATRGYLEDESGAPVMTRLNEPLLRDIARRTGGIYVPGADREAVERLRGAIEPAAPEGSPPEDGGSLPTYLWLAGAAFLLLLVEPVAGAERGRRS